MNGVSSGPHSFFTPGLCRWCCSSCQTTWTPHTCTGDDGNRGCISRASGELAEDKSPTSVQQGGQAIDDHNQREGGCASGRICLSWLSYPPNNSKLSCHIVMPSLVQLCRTWTVRYGSHVSPYSPKLKLHNTCILPIFLYYSKCLAVTKRDVHRIDAVDQWCLRKLLGIKWYHHVWNDDVRWKTEQPHLSAAGQARRLSLFSHIARMPDESGAKQILRASPLENWIRPWIRPRTTWMKTTQQELESLNLSLNTSSWRGSESSTLDRYALIVVHSRNESMNEWMMVITSKAIVLAYT